MVSEKNNVYQCQKNTGILHKSAIEIENTTFSFFHLPSIRENIRNENLFKYYSNNLSKM